MSGDLRVEDSALDSHKLMRSSEICAKDWSDEAENAASHGKAPSYLVLVDHVRPATIEYVLLHPSVACQTLRDSWSEQVWPSSYSLSSRLNAAAPSTDWTLPRGPILTSLSNKTTNQPSRSRSLSKPLLPVCESIDPLLSIRQ